MEEGEQVAESAPAGETTESTGSGFYNRRLHNYPLIKVNRPWEVESLDALCLSLKNLSPDFQAPPCMCIKGINYVTCLYVHVHKQHSCPHLVRRRG